MAKLPQESAVQASELAESAGEIPSREQVQAVVRSTTDRPEGRPRRRPAFGSSKLGVDCSKLHQAGYYCHWINDYPGRVQDALNSGYEFVSLSEVQSAPSIGAPTADLGDRVSRRVGVMENGQELVAFLMKIPLDWKHENDAYYQERADAIDRAIRTGTVEHVENAYMPKDGIKYTTRTR